MESRMHEPEDVPYKASTGGLIASEASSTVSTPRGSNTPLTGLGSPHIDPMEFSGELQSVPTTAISDVDSSMIPEMTVPGDGFEVAKMLSEVLNSSAGENMDERYSTDDESEFNEDRERIGGALDRLVSGSPAVVAVPDANSQEGFLAQTKHYFIMSMAGKLVYSRHGTDELVSAYMGILQTIVSYFEAGQRSQTEQVRSQLKSFRAGDALFVVSVQDPLILVAIDKTGQSEQQLLSQLDVLYAQVLSSLTKNQLTKVFETRTNFDLRQLLGGTEVFLNALTADMSKGSPSVLLGAVEALRLRKTIRDKINNVLIDCRIPTLLYGMVAADSRLVSVIRPKRHSLHPPDIYLVFSMLFNTTSFRDGSEHWAPICLPKFNSTGFLYAYINFFAEDVALVLISPDKNAFFELREANTKILEKLNKQNLVSPITEAVRKDRFKPLDIPAPLVKHFLYKSKPYVQFVMPSLELHYYEPTAKDRLMSLYHELHTAVHARHGQINIIYTTRQRSTALAWVTPHFELYCVTGATTKEAISQSVRAIVSWIRQYEERLFVIGGAVF